jgi:hypothetical protein
MAHPARPLGSLVIATVVGLGHVASGAETNRRVIGLLVFDYAAVSPETLGRVHEKVTHIYREANVEVDWIEPVKDRAFLMINPTSNTTGMFIVQLMVRPRRPSTPTSVPAGAESVMGTALEAGQNGGTASVFYDQVLRMAHHYRQPVEDLLALAIAHEMGHVLLPSPAHSRMGIMRADWDGDDIRHAVVGTLTFTPEEADLIRAKVAACCGGSPVYK